MREILNSNLVRHKMQMLGLNQSGISKQLGITRQAFSLWVRGEMKPKPNRLLKLARILDVPFEDLTKVVPLDKEYYRRRNKAYRYVSRQSRADDTYPLFLISGLGVVMLSRQCIYLNRSGNQVLKHDFLANPDGLSAVIEQLSKKPAKGPGDSIQLPGLDSSVQILNFEEAASPELANIQVFF